MAIGRMVMGATLVMTAACAPLPPAEAGEPPIQGESGRKCEAAGVQSLLGQQASAELGAEAMRASGAAKLRWIPEGAMITMDYSESRLNIQLDRQNKIVRIYCG
jgi:hypothetical protein